MQLTSLSTSSIDGLGEGVVCLVNVGWKGERSTELDDLVGLREDLVGCSGMEDGEVELANGVELGDGVELENGVELEDGVDLEDGVKFGDGMELGDGVKLGVTGLHEDASVYEGLTEPGAVRLIVSFTDRGDDMLFPISFIMFVLPGTHCTTSDSTLLLLLLSDIVYLWKKQV